jgi:hypothetical protein
MHANNDPTHPGHATRLLTTTTGAAVIAAPSSAYPSIQPLSAPWCAFLTASSADRKLCRALTGYRR